MSDQQTGEASSGTIRNWLIVAAVGLVAAIVFGLIWLFVVAPSLPTGNLGWFLFAFATGLTMIVLPCTLPLAFVIVPLAMGRGIVKGLGMALSFGVGVTLTLSLYGVAAALVGGAAIDALGAPLETVKNWVYFIAGGFAFVFALTEIGLLKIRMPSYSGAAPAFIQKRGDLLKAFLLGMFLGNIGVGCPHPATPLLLIEIASSGDVLYGWLLFLVHAIGRILPLLLLAFLGILGVNGLNWLVARKDKVEKATGWAMVFVAGFILTLGLFTHDWWVNSGIHTQLEKVTQEERFIGILVEQLDSEVTHTHGPEEGEGLFGLPLSLGNWFLVSVWLVPIWWWWFRKRKRVALIQDAEQIDSKEAQSRLLSVRGWGLLALSLLLALIFIYILPHNFLQHEAFEDDHGPAATGEMHTDAMDDHHADVSGGYHEEADVVEGLSVNLRVVSDAPQAGTTTVLQFFVNEKPDGTPVTDLEIEHEKFIHVIGVRDDLSNFFHIHPEPTEQAGVWSAEHVFAVPGTYTLWSDVTRNGATHSFGHAPFTVLGSGGSVREKPDFLTNVIVGEHYQVSLGHGAPVALRNASIGFTISDVFGGGVPLEPYLGADMHLAAIKDDLAVYIHTHPHGDGDDHHSLRLVREALAHGTESETEPEEVSFELVFPEVGTYKLFAQFRPEGIDLPADESLVAEFYVSVTEGGSLTKLFADDLGTPWWQRPLWWVLFIASLFLMLLLSRGVRKYLRVE